MTRRGHGAPGRPLAAAPRAQLPVSDADERVQLRAGLGAAAERSPVQDPHSRPFLDDEDGVFCVRPAAPQRNEVAAPQTAPQDIPQAAAPRPLHPEIRQYSFGESLFDEESDHLCPAPPMAASRPEVDLDGARRGAADAAPKTTDADALSDELQRQMAEMRRMMAELQGAPCAQKQAGAQAQLAAAARAGGLEDPDADE